MHIRGHLTPFSQSLANQGMQQTYQNMNQAPLQNYTNFLGGSMNLGMQPYQSSGNMMPNNNIMDYMTDPEPTPDVINPPSYVPDLNPIVPDVPEENLLTGDAYDEFTELIEQIVATYSGQGMNVDYSFVPDLQNSFIDMLQQGSSPQSISYNLFQDFIQQNNLQPLDLPDFSQPVFPNFSNVIPGQLNLGFEDIPDPYLPPYVGPPIFPDFTDVLPGGDLGFENIPEPGLPDEVETEPEIMPATTQAPQFTGGGGQGGQAARRLYFPGTSGGFASVGTGIGGGGTTLDDLLRRMR